MQTHDARKRITETRQHTSARGGEKNDQPVLCASHLRLFEAELEKKNMTTKGITWDPRLVVLSADRISFAISFGGVECRSHIVWP